MTDNTCDYYPCDALTLVNGDDIAETLHETDVNVSCNDGYTESVGKIMCFAGAWSSTPTCDELEIVVVEVVQKITLATGATIEAAQTEEFRTALALALAEELAEVSEDQ